ncbi:FAD-binding domain-containing protein [Abortiporus biennis]|nr:FAD-binding domain-containing protein [Abortiporus biennis]
MLFLSGATLAAASSIAATPISQVTSAQWDTLNSQVGGRLFQGVPFAKACFPPVTNQTACAEIQQHYTDGTIRYSFASGSTNTEWETCTTNGDQCLLDDTDPTNPLAIKLPCKLGSISPYYIDVQEPSDVSAAFNFSLKTGVPLIIHNTGHDYKGRSTAPDSLGLWTHNLKNMSYNPSFVPTGCNGVSPTAAAILGAGVQWGEAYQFADSHNITLVGGSDKGVGAVGGWLQGGGHGVLSNTLGMGVDRVLEFKVVTPDGVFRTVNQCQNQDLFFALRGGGGGTFGVVLEASILAAPPVTLQVTLISWADPSIDITKEFLTILINNTVSLAKAGYGVTATTELALFATPLLDATSAAQAMKPFTDFAQNLIDNKVTGASSVTLTLPSWLEFFNTFILPVQSTNGVPNILGSRLIPTSSFATSDSQAQLLDALMAGVSLNPAKFIILGTTPVNFKPDGKTSVTDAWRTSLWHITTETHWTWNSTLQEKTAAFATAAKTVERLRAITPDAAYSNEADVYEPNHIVAFWGTHYNDLLKVKQKYDPHHLLDCWQCVGWKSQSSRFKCYIPTSSIATPQ